MAKRPTLAERFAATRTVAPARARARKRLDRAQRGALAPVSADPAIRQYVVQAKRLAARLQAAKARGATEDELVAMTNSIARSVRAAAKRIDRQTRREMSRILGVTLPARDAKDDVLLTLFVDHNMQLYRKLARDIAAGKNAAWRGWLIAQDQSWKFEGALNEDWSIRGGDDEYYWHTCEDDRVRQGHAALDGTLQRWAAPPNTGRQEGNNNPGQAIHCRCKGIPRSALDL